MSLDVLATKAVAVTALWHKGLLSWKLKPVQRELYESYKNANQQKTIVWTCSRRLGKSYALSVIAIEKCLQQPFAIVKFVAPNAKQMRSITVPLFREVLRDCPPELQPDWRASENVFRFRNGSEVQLAGGDQGHADSLRGSNAHLCIVDEAAFCVDLRWLVLAVLMPTTLTTKGKIILSSTPPENRDHYFAECVETAELQGRLVKKTIYDALGSTLTQEEIDEQIANYGGVDSIDFRREFLCEMITDERSSVLPEVTDALLKEIVREMPVRPKHFDLYVGMDLGVVDLTVALFAYYDFLLGKLVIEDELVMSGHRMTTEYLAFQIREKERILWQSDGIERKPYLRICDNELRIIQDMNLLHGLVFVAADKDDNRAAINELRVNLAAQKILIHPRCKTLIHHLKNAVWDKSGKTYKRSPENGHYDAVDALKYLVRHMQWSRNPYPAGYGSTSTEHLYIPRKKPEPESQTGQQIMKLFPKIKPNRKFNGR